MSDYRLLVPKNYLKKLAQEIRVVDQQAVYFLGSGDYHYLSLPIMAHFTKSFSVLVFDHHIDASELIFPGMLSCGSWIRDLLADFDQVAHVYILGPDMSHGYPHKAMPNWVKQKLTILSERDLLAGHYQELAKALAGQQIYLSVDRDILATCELATSWDQGRLTSQQLCHWIEAIVPNHQLLGADICGDMNWTSQSVFNLDYKKLVSQSRQSLQDLLTTIKNLF
ncbi:hypothetical protein AWM75_01330 [Aerococcus urinaehominis]|uniref:Arginase n=1 Tax=Aerococcus urinaehominis TaxID=128944 RepID=A0A0X8FKG4_9LACT|nr:arginase family protein [Aerococcus urinaehominis]AMB98719.1 hypothetical protein AWM75_01330 [Aerococcus urinaehominis]